MWHSDKVEGLSLKETLSVNDKYVVNQMKYLHLNSWLQQNLAGESENV